MLQHPSRPPTRAILFLPVLHIGDLLKILFEKGFCYLKTMSEENKMDSEAIIVVALSLASVPATFLLSLRLFVLNSFTLFKIDKIHI